MTERALGAILAVSTAEAAADNITAATAASPVQLTAASHGISNGTIIRVTGAGGMTQINDRAFVASAVATNTLELKGVNGSGYTTYTSGGTIVAQTMTNIGKVFTIGPGFNGQTPEIDTSHLRSVVREYLGALPESGEIAFGFYDESDTGQTRVKLLQESGAVVAWSITLATTGRIGAFLGYVKQCGFDELGVDTAVKGAAIIKVTNRWADFA